MSDDSDVIICQVIERLAHVGYSRVDCFYALRVETGTVVRWFTGDIASAHSFKDILAVVTGITMRGRVERGRSFPVLECISYLSSQKSISRLGNDVKGIFPRQDDCGGIRPRQ